jgi:hypothetical protein
MAWGMVSVSPSITRLLRCFAVCSSNKTHWIDRKTYVNACFLAHFIHSPFFIRIPYGVIWLLRSGEGLVAEFAGSGKIHLQSRSQDSFLSWMIPWLPNKPTIAVQEAKLKQVSERSCLETSQRVLLTLMNL